MWSVLLIIDVSMFGDSAYDAHNMLHLSVLLPGSPMISRDSTWIKIECTSLRIHDALHAQV